MTIRNDGLVRCDAEPTWPLRCNEWIPQGADPLCSGILIPVQSHRGVVYVCAKCGATYKEQS